MLVKTEVRHVVLAIIKRLQLSPKLEGWELHAVLVYLQMIKNLGLCTNILELMIGW